MDKAKVFFRKYGHLLLLLYIPFHFWWYEAARFFGSDGEIWMIESELDALIPFCEWFIIPYCLWYFYIAAVAVYSVFAGRREYYRFMCLYILSMLIPMIIITAAPNGIPLSMRPDFDSLGRDNLGITLVKLIYSIDSPPRCVFPSMHTTVSVGLAYAVCRMNLKKQLKAASVVLSTLIVLSTVLVKQHSVIDVFGGLAVSALILLTVYFAEKHLVKQG